MKRIISPILFALGFLTQIAIVSADEPFVRFNTGCQLLLNSSRIYCYSGGYAKNVGMEVTPLADHYYLDVKDSFDIATGQKSWMRVSDPPNYITEATFGYNSVKLSDTSVLINGGTGINDGKTSMKNRTAIYHADKNEWESVDSTTSFPASYYSSGALAGDGTVIFWGGSGIVGDPTPTFNGTAKLLLSTKEWSLQPNAIAPGNPRYGHSATADPTGKLIYYFGGRSMIRDASTGIYTRPFSPFTSILIYHTDTSVWETKIASTGVTPSNRMSHTATWIPGTDNIFIYGGSNLDNIGTRLTVQDYAYIYNTKSNSFQNVTVKASPGAEGAGPRFGHSAVIRNNALFILFGIDNTKFAGSDFHVMDLDSYTWQTQFDANKGSSNSNNNNGNGSNNNNSSSNNNSNSGKNGDGATTSKSISSGAIAGIVVGVVAVIAIILLLLCLRRRSKKKKEEKINNEYTPYWDVTSLNDKKDKFDANEVPLTSTGPVDITKLPGFTTCRTGQPTNITNDQDVNPPPSNPQVLLSDNRKAEVQENISSPHDTTSSHTYTNDVSEPEKLWPPDAPKKSIVTPSVPVQYTKPDIGKR